MSKRSAGAWIASPVVLEAAAQDGARRRLGGKGAGLARLAGLGLSVPTFGVLTPELFHRWDCDGSIPAETRQEVLRDLEAWGARRVAVRSSGVDEDAGEASFAGLYETRLNVPTSQLWPAVEEVYRSVGSSRLQAYAAAKGQAGARSPRLAVVIQQMLEPESSGVTFSRKPVGNSALVCIESTYGLGLGVVDGVLAVDSFEWDRFGHELSVEIADKASRIERRAGGGVCAISVPEELRRRPSLTAPLRRDLVNCALRLEEAWGRPVDLEWAVSRGQLFVLQTRPITAAFPPLRCYADTNLSESYPGRSSPLTQDFVRTSYTQVFTDAARFLGASPARLQLLVPHYRRLVAAFEGHLYYDLNSYYAAISALPGGAGNLGAWHQMVGGQLAGTVELPNFPPFSMPELLRIGRALLRLSLGHRRLVRDFCRRSGQRVEQLQAGLRRRRKASSRELTKYLLQQIRDTDGWAVTALNDVVIMKNVHALARLLQAHGLGDPVLVGLLRTRAGTESMLPERELREMAHHCARAAGFVAAAQELLSRAPALEGDALLAALSSRFAAESARVERFLERFGDRSFDELKLESLTFRQSPRGFLELLLWRIRSTGAAEERRRLPDPRGALDGLGLRGLLRWRVERRRHRVEQAILARESCRLVRGRYFGWVRETLLTIWSRLADENPALFVAGDRAAIFELGLADLERYASGGCGAEALMATIDRRRSRTLARYVYPEHLVHPDGDPSAPTFAARSTGTETAPGRDLVGVGAAPGIVRGRALVIFDPREALAVPDLSSWILVTPSTDPAWVFLLSQCRGLVSERGSLLSHTAIIGRELGIPTVVNVAGATTSLPTGTPIEIDGARGRVMVLS